MRALILAALGLPVAAFSQSVFPPVANVSAAAPASPNTVVAGPAAGAGAAPAAPRALVPADIPGLPYASTASTTAQAFAASITAPSIGTSSGTTGAMNLNYVPGNPATSPGTNAFQVSPLVPITTPWTLSPAPAPGTGVMTAVGSAGSAQQGFTPTLGTDTNIPTASSLAGAAGAPACNDANGGLTTLGCAAAAVTYAAVANQWLTAYSATTGQFTSAPVASTQLSDTANVARLNANNNFTVAQTAPAYIGTNGFRGYIYGENDITSSPSMSISQGTFITIYVKLQAGTNVAFAMPTSSSTGQVLNLCWEQNATTASTVVPPSNVHGFFSASGGAIGTTLGKTNCQSYISSLGATSTGWYATSGGSINE